MPNGSGIHPLSCARSSPVGIVQHVRYARCLYHCIADWPDNASGWEPSGAYPLPVPSQLPASAASRPHPPQLCTAHYLSVARPSTLLSRMEMPAGYACSSCSKISRACSEDASWVQAKSRHPRMRSGSKCLTLDVLGRSGVEMCHLTLSGSVWHLAQVS
jgi:hypothetical protein